MSHRAFIHNKVGLFCSHAVNLNYLLYGWLLVGKFQLYMTDGFITLASVPNCWVFYVGTTLEEPMKDWLWVACGSMPR